MNSFQKALENPMVRLGASTCWLLAVSALTSPLLIRLFNLLGIFERFFFERWWNLDKATWLAIVLTLLFWAALSLAMGFDPLVWAGAAGAFFVWAVFVRNIAFELPDLLTRLVLVAESALALGGVVLGLATLIRSEGSAVEIGASHGSAAMSAPAQAESENRTAGWYPDPRGEATWRWWDGSAWTENTN